jgi:hypothetical protein
VAGKRLPWTKFEPRAWLTDQRLRVCSLAARGLWIDLLCLMWDSDRRGYLLVNGKSPTLDALARLVGASTAEISRHLQELEDSGVCSRDTSDVPVLYSRRMVREEADRAGTRERVSRHRNSQRNGHGNGDVTRERKSHKQIEDPPPRPPARTRREGPPPAAGAPEREAGEVGPEQARRGSRLLELVQSRKAAS